MRLKEFTIFIVIFTIGYTLFFFILDKISDKISEKNNMKEKDNLLNTDKLKKFANFYQIDININREKLLDMYKYLLENTNINLNEFANKCSITPQELIIIILYLEYAGLIKKRCILKEENCTVPINTKDEILIAKYGLYTSNKFDYNSIVSKVGLNSDKELEYLNERFLMPGVILVNQTLYYVGDLNE